MGGRGDILSCNLQKQKRMKTLKYSGTVEEKGEGVEGQDECVSSCGRDTLAFAWVAVRGGLMPLA